MSKKARAHMRARTRTHTCTRARTQHTHRKRESHTRYTRKTKQTAHLNGEGPIAGWQGHPLDWEGATRSPHEGVDDVKASGKRRLGLQRHGQGARQCRLRVRCPVYVPAEPAQGNVRVEMYWSTAGCSAAVLGNAGGGSGR